jgi:hypothetical protein
MILHESAGKACDFLLVPGLDEFADRSGHIDHRNAEIGPEFKEGVKQFPIAATHIEHGGRGRQVWGYACGYAAQIHEDGPIDACGFSFDACRQHAADGRTDFHQTNSGPDLGDGSSRLEARVPGPAPML